MVTAPRKRTLLFITEALRAFTVRGEQEPLGVNEPTSLLCFQRNWSIRLEDRLGEEREVTLCSSETAN